MNVIRVFAALFSLLMIGTAVAQPPVDYTLQCDNEDIIGIASFVDGEFHVAVLAGTTCTEGTLLEDGRTFSIVIDEVTGVVTISIFDSNETLAAIEVEAIEVPQQALDGMLDAAQNRAAAGERRGQGQETAAAKRAEHQPALPAVTGDPVDVEMLDQPELPVLPELPVVPELPEAAGNRRP
jgi:hypothetical protein